MLIMSALQGSLAMEDSVPDSTFLAQITQLSLGAAGMLRSILLLLLRCLPPPDASHHLPIKGHQEPKRNPPVLLPQSPKRRQPEFGHPEHGAPRARGGHRAMATAEVERRRVLRHGLPGRRVLLAGGRRGYHPLRRVQRERPREQRLLTGGMAIILAMLAREVQGKEQAVEEHLVGDSHRLGLLGDR